MLYSSSECINAQFLVQPVQIILNWRVVGNSSYLLLCTFLRVLFPKHCNIPGIMQYCMERGLNVLVLACLCMLVPLM